MITIKDVQSVIEHEFDSRLGPHGFRRVRPRCWLRNTKLPVRELFCLGSLKGGRYSPSWGFSSGMVPAFRGKSFVRQSTDKNAIMDLIIDPIDITAKVPQETFSFISGFDTEIPTSAIRTCAEHFVPLALADFNRVHSLTDFCKFFLQRSKLHYRRIGFENYVQQTLAFGFVLILRGKRTEGMERIREFCRTFKMSSRDRILTEYVHKTESRSSV